MLLAGFAALGVLIWAGTSTGREPPRPSLYVLTNRRITQVDRPTGRVFRTVRSPGLEARRMAAGFDTLLVWGGRTVTTLDGTTLAPKGRASFDADVADAAVAGTLIVVASGRFVHVMREDLGGTLARMRVPKAMHALAAFDSIIYALDDVVTPYYVHHITLDPPQAPKVSTLQLGDVSGRAEHQAVGDRWYVLASGQRGMGGSPSRTTMLVLPLDPPLRVLERWPIDDMMSAFVVYDGAMYWSGTDGDGRLQLYRRGATASGGREVAARLGQVGDVPAHGLVRVGSTLFLAAGRNVWAVDLLAKHFTPVLAYRGSDPILAIAAR